MGVSVALLRSLSTTAPVPGHQVLAALLLAQALSRDRAAPEPGQDAPSDGQLSCSALGSAQQ